MLTDEQLLDCIANGESFKDIAVKFGVTTGSIAGRTFRMRKKSVVIIAPRKVGAKLKKKSEVKSSPQYKPFDPSLRANIPFDQSKRNKFFLPKAPELTKNEMRAMLREAVENTSRM